MGQEDREWYRDAVRQRERRERLQDKRRLPSTGQTVRRSTLLMVLFWALALGGLFWYFKRWEAQQVLLKRPTMTQGGALVIPKSPDGHFRLLGHVNGQAVNFLVDTGASLVSVTDAVAAKANLGWGEEITVQTANGPRTGSLHRGVTVEAGGAVARDVKVGAGLLSERPADALLGQSYLSRFDILIEGDTMTLRPRQGPARP